MMHLREYEEGSLPETEWERYALAFAQRLVDRNFGAAFEMLSRELKSKYGIAGLERCAMKLIHEEFVPMQNPPWILWSSTDRPDKRPTEIGVAYIHVGGDFNEALMPMVFMEEEAMKVGEIVWHRP
jgi:hypothetical protein